MGCDIERLQEEARVYASLSPAVQLQVAQQLCVNEGLSIPDSIEDAMRLVIGKIAATK